MKGWKDYTVTIRHGECEATVTVRALNEADARWRAEHRKLPKAFAAGAVIVAVRLAP